jgi:adenosylmethionine-8-amino-7-oxononanoate aminotransferase
VPNVNPQANQKNDRAHNHRRDHGVDNPCIAHSVCDIIKLAMSHVFHRSSVQSYPVAQTGHGCWLVDSSGKEYLDACGGAAVSALGHQHPKIIEAMHAQVDRLAYAHTSFFTSEPAERLAHRLVERAPFFGNEASQKLDRVYLVSSGSEGIEAALKLARQAAIERGENERVQLIARRQSYHGNTLGALAVGGNAWRRAQFRELLMPVRHVSPCYEYRERQEHESSESFSQRLLGEFEQTVLEIGPSKVLAFVAEPVVGATLGAVPPTPGYFKGIREICDRYGITLILDEVMCGMGRTGSLFAYEQEKIQPDIVVIAKGLGGGYQPIAALLASQAIHDAIMNGSGFFQHGHTYLGHPVACATACAVLDVMTGEQLVEHVGAKSELLRQGLFQALGDHPNVGDIRGRGLFWGIELVADRGTKEPLPVGQKTHARIKKQAMANGLMCYPMGGTLDGQRGDHILLAPPLIISEAEITELLSRLTKTVREVMGVVTNARL